MTRFKRPLITNVFSAIFLPINFMGLFMIFMQLKALH